MAYTQERIPGLGEAGASIGGAIAAWGNKFREDKKREAGEKFWTNILKEPDVNPDGSPQGEDLHAGLRSYFRGMDPKDVAQLVGSDAFTPEGLVKLTKLGQAGKQGAGLIKGEMIGESVGMDLSGYLFQSDPETGKLSALVKPERPFALSPGATLTTADGKPIAKAPDRVQIQSVSEGGTLVVTDPNDKTATPLYYSPKSPDSGLGQSTLVESGSTKERNPVTGATETVTQMREWVPRKGGGGFLVDAPPMIKKTEIEPLNKVEAGAVTGARTGVEIVGELRKLLFQGPKGELNTAALASNALGLPGIVAPEGASIEPQIKQAVDPYVRLTTGAALNEQEQKNAVIMFTPRLQDGKALIKNKLDRLERFLSGDLALMGVVAVPGSDVSAWLDLQRKSPAGPQVSPSGSSLPTVKSRADYDKLPSGTSYMWNGQTGRKP